MQDKSQSGVGVKVAQQTLQSESNGSIPITPHDFVLREITLRSAIMINKMWHSVLPDCHLGSIAGSRRAIAWGFYFKGKVYAIAIWSSPINCQLDDGSRLELRRYAICPEAPKNTASWGLRIMRNLIYKKFPEIKSLLSYQAVAYHNGTIYKADNWIKSAECKFVEWKANRQGRSHREQQIKCDKIRWEWIYANRQTQAVPSEQSLNRNLTEFSKKENSKMVATQEIR